MVSLERLWNIAPHKLMGSHILLRFPDQSHAYHVLSLARRDDHIASLFWDIFPLTMAPSQRFAIWWMMAMHHAARCLALSPQKCLLRNHRYRSISKCRRSGDDECRDDARYSTRRRKITKMRMYGASLISFDDANAAWCAVGPAFLIFRVAPGFISLWRLFIEAKKDDESEDMILWARVSFSNAS